MRLRTLSVLLALGLCVVADLPAEVGPGPGPVTPPAEETTSPQAARYLDQARAAISAARPEEVIRALNLALAFPLSRDDRLFAERELKIALDRLAHGPTPTPGDTTPVEPRVADAMRRLNDLLDSGRPLNEADLVAWRELSRARPDDPLLARVAQRFFPAWAVTAGVDPDGRFALARVGRVLVRMRLIQPGTVRRDDGVEVTVTRAFWIAETETTIDLWIALEEARRASQRDATPVDEALRTLDGRLPASGLGPARIVQLVQELGRQLPGATVRLPTSTEWEYAARAGETGPWLDGFTSRRHGAYERLAIEAVGGYAANAFGLYDVHGSVWELVTAPDGTLLRRGGGWRSRREACRLDQAHTLSHLGPDLSLGWRIVIDDSAAPAPATTPPATPAPAPVPAGGR